MIPAWHILENIISKYLWNLLICLKLHRIWRSLLKLVLILSIRSICFWEVLGWDTNKKWQEKKYCFSHGKHTNVRLKNEAEEHFCLYLWTVPSGWGSIKIHQSLIGMHSGLAILNQKTRQPEHVILWITKIQNTISNPWIKWGYFHIFLGMHF